jgi:succinoglycan biosynthesis transport protein ExoP
LSPLQNEENMAGNLTPLSALPAPEPSPHSLVPAQDPGLLSGPVEPREEGVNWGRYVSALKRYRWLMLLIILIGSTAGIVATRFIPPSYTAQTTIWVESQNSKGPLRPTELLQESNWIDLLRSNVVYDPVVVRLKLYLKPDHPEDSTAFAGFDTERSFKTGVYTLVTSEDGTSWTLSSQGQDPVRGAVGDSIGVWLGWRWAPTADKLGAGKTIRFTVSPPREVSSDINSRLTARLPQDGTFMRVNLEGQDRKELARTLNAVAQEFVDVAADLKRRKLTELRIALDSQVQTARQNMVSAQAQLQNYQINTITRPRNSSFAIAPGLTSTQSSATSQYFQQKTQLEAIRADRQQLEVVLARATAGALSADAFQTIAAVKNAPQLGQALSDLTRAESEYAALGQRYTPEHPAMKQIAAVAAELRSERIPSLARDLIDQLKYQEQDLEKRIAAAGTELRDVPAVTITEMALQREYNQAEGLYNMLATRLEQAKLEELSAIPDVRILDEANVPGRPASNSAPKIILMALAGSIGLALALALLLDQIDQRFRYPEQVSSDLGLAILGAVPAFRKNRAGELPADQALQVTEAFRTIRLNLAHSYGAAGPVLLTVSSAGAGDGKSVVSANLALSFARAGYRTLLIDGDIRRGELHRMFGVDRRPGLLDYLTGSATMEEIIRATTQEGVWTIPCGARRHHGPELLGSAAMSELMGFAKARFNVIIVDSPPLSAGIDAFVLGTATGHLMMVFRTGETDRQMAEAKLRLLDRLPVRVLGAVLNEIETDGVYRYYSYLYGYHSDEEMPAGALPSPPQTNGAGG